MSISRIRNNILLGTIVCVAAVACSSRNKSNDEITYDENFSSEQSLDESLDAEGLGSDDELAELSLDELENGADATQESFSEDTSIATEELSFDEELGTADEVAQSAQLPTSAPAPVEQSNQSAYQLSEMPKVSTAPFIKNGFAMNAFYFVQKPNESYESLSTLLYGRPDRAKLLRDWNDNKMVQVGEVFYYNSPFRAEDQSKMLMLSQDFNLETIQWKVKTGETLSQIAQKVYGTPKAWRNIAGINPQIKGPDDVEVGQTIYVEPAGPKTASKLAQLRRQLEEVEQREKEAKKENEVAQADQTAIAANTDDQSGEGDNPLGSETEDIGNPIDSMMETNPLAADTSQDMTMLYLGGGLILAAIALLVIRRRKARG